MSAGYESAPATQLLATQCAVCGRPLVDATSVETGMGPTCREQHGYGEAQSEPDWVKAHVALVVGMRGAGQAWDWTPAGWAAEGVPGDVHKAANCLVHRIACAVDPLPAIVAMVQAVHHLGYATLAKRIGERLVRIEVALEGNVYVLRAPYSDEANQAYRAVPGRRWDHQRKANTFPMRARAAFWRALQVAFPGEHARGPNGYFRIGGAT